MDRRDIKMNIILICKYCKKLYERKKYKEKKSKYCSKKCGLLYRWSNKNERNKLLKSRKNMWNDEKKRKNQSKRMKERYAKNPNLRKTVIEVFKRNWRDVVLRKKMIRYGKNNPFYQKKHTKHTKNLLKRLAKKQWKNEKYRKLNSGVNAWSYGRITPKHEKKLISKTSYEHWKSSGYQKKQILSRHLRPNKIELKLNKILSQNFPKEYKYVGDFQVWIGGKNPDFMNINGQKKLIEFYGTYWHKDENPKDRINHFKKYGFDTLVIWDKELKNTPILEQKLELFHNK